jgi:3-isopropylmalate/(R)-2-methylmalate dehydratase large subunit
MVVKIVSRQVGRKVAAGEKIERLPITRLFFNDVIGPLAIEGFRANFTEVLARYGAVPRGFDPKRLYFLPDHSVPTFSMQIAKGVKLMKEFAKETGAKMYKEGDGIEHVVLSEDGSRRSFSLCPRGLTCPPNRRPRRRVCQRVALGS